MLSTLRRKKGDPILLTEWEESPPIYLGPEDIDYIQLRINEGKPNSKIELIPKGKDFVIKSQNWVGAVVLPSGMLIYIEPKFKLSFFRMLTFVLDIREWKPYEREVTAAPGALLADMIATLFIRRAEEVIKFGLSKSYMSEEENLKYIKGRVLLPQQLRTNVILKHKTYCRYDELSNDIPENQAILFSAHVLKNLVLKDEIKRKVNEVAVALLSDGVSLVRVRGHEIASIVITRLNDYYESILELCKFIAEYTWVEKLWEEGEVPVLSFLIDMNALFEDFVTKLVRETMFDFEVIPQKKMRNLLSKPPSVELTQDLLRHIVIKPDIILEKNRTKILVMDAKYKRDYSNDDVYQALAYSLAYKTSAVLILPREDRDIIGRYDVIEVPNSRVFITTLNLSVYSESFEDYIQTLKNELLEKIGRILSSQQSPNPKA